MQLVSKKPTAADKQATGWARTYNAPGLGFRPVAERAGAPPDLVRRRPHRVVALAIPAVVVFDLSIAAQVFGYRDERARYSFEVCSVRPGSVPTSTAFAIEVDRGLEALDDADTVVVPGFHPLDTVDQAVGDALQKAAARGARITSVCVGAFALAMAGLLDGRAATTHWAFADDFRRRFPAVHLDPDVLYVDSGQVLTSAGISAGIDLCLYLVRQDYGEHVAADVARRMVVATQRAGGQLQYARGPLPVDGGLGPTRDWAITQLDRPLGVPQLAGHASMSVRSFTRRFRAEVGESPMQWLAAQRVREAQRLLEATTLSVEEVARRCGFGTVTTLRTQLARALGTTPTAYRQEHRRRVGGG
jgi:transcriptional regulator GlxA family with amidase domain